MSETIREQLYHGHLYLIDDKPPRATGDCSIFVRRLRLVRTPKGNLHVKIAADVWTFPDEDSMLAAIERYGIRELPEKADGDPLFVPGEFVVPGAKVEREYVKRIAAPAEPPVLAALTTADPSGSSPTLSAPQSSDSGVSDG